MSALPVTSGLTLLTQWRIDPLALVFGVAAGSWYLAMRRRAIGAGGQWRWTRTAVFLLGVAGYLWCTNGFLNAYSATLFWVWSIQVLALLLVVPVLLMAGQPVQLASRTARRPSLLAAAVSSRPARLLAHPFVGPAVIPVLTAVVFFGHVAHVWTRNTVTATGIGLVLVGLGALIAVPLTIEDHGATSLAVGAILAISVLELLTDAVPGIVLRLSKHLVSSHFATRHAGWAMAPHTDQQLSGAILWGVAEMLDLPFLAIVFLRWVRTDEREAHHVDRAIHDAVGRSRNAASDVPVGGAPPTDQPWWLTDPQLSTRPGIAPDRNGRAHR
jgi:cytochrome c oxidase assembly factor CtaG